MKWRRILTSWPSHPVLHQHRRDDTGHCPGIHGSTACQDTSPLSRSDSMIGTRRHSPPAPPTSGCYRSRGRWHRECSSVARPLLCVIAIGVSFGAQHPTARAACVGCTASANKTASSADQLVQQRLIALDERGLLRLFQLARYRLWFAMFNAEAVQQRDQTIPCPGTQCRIPARSRRRPRGSSVAASSVIQACQLVLLLRLQPARTALIAETRQTLDAVLLIQPIPGPDRVVVQGTALSRWLRS